MRTPVWVSPSTVERVLARHGLVLAGQPRPPRSTKAPWPEGCEWRPNQLWVWDASQFEACEASKYAYGIIDLVSRKWIAVTLTPEPNSVSARALFLKALEAENLLTDDITNRLNDNEDVNVGNGDAIPLLVAISDKGPEMKALDTRRFMAVCSIAQHFGRPSTPTDQAWIESLWGHTKRHNPHLETVNDPAMLATELEWIRRHYNNVRLHEAIGYVTPNDEHSGRGDTIRTARRDGLNTADQARRAWHRNHPTTP